MAGHVADEDDDMLLDQLSKEEIEQLSDMIDPDVSHREREREIRGGGRRETVGGRAVMITAR